MKPNPALDEWFAKLKQLAESKHVGWLIVDRDAYTEYFEDGCTPEETLEIEIEEARALC